MIAFKFKENKIHQPAEREWLRLINHHGGFGTLNEEDSYCFSMEFNLEGLIQRYKGVSAVSASDDSEKEAILSKIKKEMETNPEVKDKEKYSYNFVVEIKWFQKN